MTVNAGEVCPSCERRVPHPRQSSTPDTAVLGVRLPAERKTELHEGLKALAEFTGASRGKYPIGTLLEMLLGLGAQNRLDLRNYFARQGDYE